MLELNRLAINSLYPKLVPTLRPNHTRDTGIPSVHYFYKTISKTEFCLKKNVIYSRQLYVLKGTVSRDFLLQVFFINHLPPSP
jgi:hypothetical protein